MTSFDQLELNVKLLTDLTLNETEKNDLLADMSHPGLYCSGCMSCTSSCPRHLPVPDMMRAYMYAYGYASPTMAKDLLSELNVKSDPCAGCGSCTVSCSRNFNVREKIADVSRLANIPSEFLA
jgi:ferredoxin